MLQLLKVVLCISILGVAGWAQSPAGAQAQLTPLPTADLVIGSLPDSIRSKLFAALAVGELEGAVAAYMAHKGLTDAPKWLLAFRSAFHATSMRMGQCQQVAQDIHTALMRFGASPQYVRITSTGGEFLSWRGRALISDNNFHVAVRYQGRIYDAFTGPAGLAEEQYRAAVQYLGRLNIAVMESP